MFLGGLTALRILISLPRILPFFDLTASAASVAEVLFFYSTSQASSIQTAAYAVSGSVEILEFESPPLKRCRTSRKVSDSPATLAKYS